MDRVKISQIIYICMSILLIYSCSPKISRNFLSFFFDGAPSVVADSLNVVSSTHDPLPAADLTVTPGDSLRDKTFYHYPYKENYCTSCHDESSSSEMIMPEPDLCYSCHEDYSIVYHVVHGPAAGGYCTLCHQPHMSDEAKLLIRTGRSLCLYCHDGKMISRNPAHADNDTTDCTICHNPHGGNDRYLIR